MDAQTYIEDVRKLVKSHSTKLPIYKKLGYSTSDVEKLNEIFEDWVGSPNRQMFRAAQSLVRGNLRTKVTKMLAVEREIARKAIKQPKITLYRGVDNSYADRIKKAIQRRQWVTIPLWGATSWSSDKESAEEFGWLVIEHEFPTDFVVSCHLTHGAFDNYHEQEYIVAVPEKKIKVHRSKIHLPPDEDESDGEDDWSW